MYQRFPQPLAATGGANGSNISGKIWQRVVTIMVKVSADVQPDLLYQIKSW